jgi:putative chitinase
MTSDQILAIMPLAKPHIAAFFSPLCAAMTEFEINTPTRQAAFLAQIGHESASLSRVVENLNYSPEGLMATFNNAHAVRFDHDAACRYGRTAEHPADQVSIANIAYANRMGNGTPESGDGWRHRGAGLIQLTGKENHLAAALYFGIGIDKIGDWLRTAEGACRSAAWIWHASNCNAFADRGDFDGVSDVINIGRKTAKQGDAIGYAARRALYDKATEVLT